MSETRTNEQEAAAYQAGEREALDRLWSNNQGVIKSRCFRFYIQNQESCAAHGVTFDDITQEAFFALLEAVQAFKEEAGYKFLTWLNFPLKKRFNALLGRRENAAVRPLDHCQSLDELVGEDDQTPRGELIPDPGAEKDFQDAEQNEYNKQLHNVLEAAMSTLEKPRREILECRYFERLSYQQSADRVGCNISMSRSLEQKALRDMRKGEPMRLLKEFLRGTSFMYNGTGFQAWKYKGSVEERIIERVEERSQGRMKIEQNFR